MMFDRIDAITELYSLGAEAENTIGELAKAQDLATMYRLQNCPILAQSFSTDASVLAAELEKIGQRQQYLMGELVAAGEGFYL